MKKHRLTHIREKCDKCGKKTSGNLELHKCTPTEAKKICHKCGKMTSGSLKLHRCELKCAKCDKTFLSVKGFKEHNHNNHRCVPCNETFGSLNALREHKQMHHSEQYIACDRCPALFTSNSNMIRHRALHTGTHKHKEPVYRCVVYYFFTKTVS